jgi:hypothetical protein
MPDIIDPPVAAPAPAPAATPAPASPAPPASQTPIRDPFGDVIAQPAKKADAAPPKPGEKPAAPAQAAPKPGEKVVAAKKDPVAEQRARIDQQNTLIKQKDEELVKIRQEVEQLRQSSGGDAKSLSATIEKLQNENKQLRGELGARDYTKSEEYTGKYEKPFNDAAEYGKNVIESLTVTDADGVERAADWKKDFAPIYSLPRAAARARAREMFGEDAPSVMQQYDDLHRIDAQRQKAVQEWQATAEEREKTTRGTQIANQQKVAKGFELVTSKLTESDPLFQIKPDDAESSDLWKKSEAVVNQAYYNRSGKTLAELVVLDAAIRMRAINEPVLRARLAKVEAELADYKDRVNGRERSRGGDVRRVAEPAGEGESENWEKELTSKLKAAV